MSDEKEKIKIPHHRANHFVSAFSSGAIFAGPTGDGLYHLVFYADAVGVTHETGIKISETGGEIRYATSVESGDTAHFREDKARISMTADGLRSLLELLQTRIKVADKGDK